MKGASAGYRTALAPFMPVITADDESGALEIAAARFQSALNEVSM